MSTFLEILKYVLPALIVFFTTYYVVRSFLRNEEQRRRQDRILNNQKLITPLRLQAYERIVHLLEKVSINAMLKRLHKKEMTVSQLQGQMLSTIRAEFDNNISQQIYISHEAWQMAVIAKENIIKLINSIASKIKPNAPAINLSKRLLEETVQMDKTPSSKAIEYIKKEVHELF